MVAHNFVAQGGFLKGTILKTNPFCAVHVILVKQPYFYLTLPSHGNLFLSIFQFWFFGRTKTVLYYMNKSLITLTEHIKFLNIFLPKVKSF